MGREIRRVPTNHNHPKDKSWNYISMMGMSAYEDCLKDWKEGKKDWKDWWYESYRDYLDWKPLKKEFHEEWEWYQLYQNVSEWTPLSPSFATPEELIEWLSNNLDFRWKTRTREWATAIVWKWFAFSGIMQGGKFYSPEEQHLLK